MFEPPPYHPDRPGLVAPVRRDESGVRGPTQAQSRGPKWRRSSRGLFVPSDVPATPEQRIVEAAAVLRESEAITGWAALHWLRARWFGGRAADGGALPVPIAVRRHVRKQPLIEVSQEFLPTDDLLLVDGVPITTARRSVSFEARRARTLGQAVTVVDMAAYDDLVSIEEMQEYAARLLPVTGIGRLREAIALADENAWSPTEVTMRGVWLGAGFPQPLTNRPIFDLTGRHVATPDLLDPAAGVAGEYEGGVHLVGARRAADVEREGRLRHHGFEVVTMTGADLRDPGAFLARLSDAYRGARVRRTPDTWTLDPPAWWTPTDTVVRRRALSERERAVWLAHRRAA